VDQLPEVPGRIEDRVRRAINSLPNERLQLRAAVLNVVALRGSAPAAATASIARSRRPFFVVASGAFSSAWACRRDSQLPTRTPFDFAPFTREMADAPAPWARSCIVLCVINSNDYPGRVVFTMKDDLMRVARPVNLNPEQRRLLEKQSRTRSLPARQVERARIVLRAADGEAGQGYCCRIRHHAREGGSLAQSVGTEVLQKGNVAR
jgi:hypothetical protein